MPVNSTFSGSFFPRSTQLNLYDKSDSQLVAEDKFIIDTASIDNGSTASLIIARKENDVIDPSKDVDVRMKMKLSQRSGKNMNDVGAMHYALGDALYKNIYKSGSYGEDDDNEGDASSARGVANEAAIAAVASVVAVSGVDDYKTSSIAPAVLQQIPQEGADKSRVEAVENRTQAIRNQLQESIKYIGAAASTAYAAKDQLGFSTYGSDRTTTGQDLVYNKKLSIPEYLKGVGVFDNAQIAPGHGNRHMDQTKQVISDIEALIGIQNATNDQNIDLTNPEVSAATGLSGADYDAVKSALCENNKLKNVVWKLGARDEKLSRALYEEAQDRVSQDIALSNAVEERRQLLEDMLKKEIAATNEMEIRLDARIQHLVSNTDASALDSMREVAEIFNEGQGGLLGHMSKVQSKVDDIVAVLNALIGANYQGAGADAYLSYLSGSMSRASSYIDEEHSNADWSNATSTPAAQNTASTLGDDDISAAQSTAEAGVTQATADVDAGVTHNVSNDVSHATDAI